MDPRFTRLPSWGQLHISGIDAEKFLQGQLTVDVTTVNEDNSRLAAYCNLQGRVEALFWLTRNSVGFIAYMPQCNIEYTMNILKKYAVFSKVKCLKKDNEASQLLSQQEVHEFHVDNIKNQMPWIIENNAGHYLPHYLNLDTLGAIDFDKGCYLGQEIIARMHYKGKIKQHARPYHLTTELSIDKLINEKLFLKNQSKKIAEIVDVAESNQGITALIIIADDLIEHSEIHSLNADNIKIHLKKT